MRHDVRAVQNLQGAHEHAENRRYCEETVVTVREPSAPRLAACFPELKKKAEKEIEIVKPVQKGWKR